MKRLLLVLRHGKSDWGEGFAPDFERPLNKRGRKSAKFMGNFIADLGYSPELLVTSPANRALSTAIIISKQLGGLELLTADKMYLADHDDIYDVLADIPEKLKCALIIGHNPGLEELVDDLCGGDEVVLKTCTLAIIKLNNCSWQGLSNASGKLVGLYHPRELMGQAD